MIANELLLEKSLLIFDYLEKTDVIISLAEWRPCSEFAPMLASLGGASVSISLIDSFLDISVLCVVIIILKEEALELDKERLDRVSCAPPLTLRSFSTQNVQAKCGSKDVRMMKTTTMMMKVMMVTMAV